jgi:hypothetical protein
MPLNSYIAFKCWMFKLALYQIILLVFGWQNHAAIIKVTISFIINMKINESSFMKDIYSTN